MERKQRWKMMETDQYGVTHEFIVYADTKEQARKLFGVSKKTKIIKGPPLEEEYYYKEGDLA